MFVPFRYSITLVIWTMSLRQIHKIKNIAKNVEISVPKFFQILHEFSKLFGVRLHPQLLHHCLKG